MNNKDLLIYGGGAVVIIAGAYLYLTRNKEGDVLNEYDYQIYNDNNITKALNIKTNQIDFQDANSGLVIQNAINNTTTDPKIHITSGFYTGGPIQGKPHLVMHGQGRDTIYQLAPNSNTTTLDVKSGSIITNLTIDGNKLNQSSPGQCINLFNSSDTILQNLYVKNAKGWDCINADTCDNIKIINSEIEGADGFGTRLKNTSNSIIDNNNYHHNNKINIDLDTSSNNIITNNLTYDSLEDGIALDFNSTNNLVQYNKAYNNLHFGITTDTVHQPHYGHNTIDNNQVYSNGWDGIISIRGDYNIISNNKSHDNALSGIRIEGLVQSVGTDATGRSNYNDIINNECWNNDYGIRELPLPNYVCQYNKFLNNNNHDNRIVNELLEGTNHR